MIWNKKRYYAVFTIKQIKSYNIVGLKKINPFSKSVSFKKHTFVIDIENPTYLKSNKIFYFFSLTSEKQLYFEKSDTSNINTEVIDTIMSQNIVKQLTSNLNTKWKIDLTMIAIGCIIGVLLGYLVGNAYPLTVGGS